MGIKEEIKALTLEATKKVLQARRTMTPNEAGKYATDVANELGKKIKEMTKQQFKGMK